MQVNCACILFMFKHNDKYYNKLCRNEHKKSMDQYKSNQNATKELVQFSEEKEVIPEVVQE